MNVQRILADVRRDFSYAFRVLRRNLLLTVVIVGALATGIGANTAIFTLIDAVLMQRLPVAHPEQLVGIGDPTRVTGRSTGGVGMDLLSYPLYHALAEHHELFTGVLASGSAGRLDVRIDSLHQDLEHPRGRWVSGNYFDVLGVPALRGRTFDATAAEQPGGSPTVVISHGYWTRRFQNDPSIIGRAILIDGVRMIVIGVTPPSFTGDVVGITYDLWLPATMHDILEPNLRSLDRRSVSWLLSIGRLRPGVTLAQASDRVPTILAADAIANSVPGAIYVAGSPGTRTFIESAERGFSRVRDTFHAPLVTLMVGVALLLCIICANVANLLLARAVARGREMTVRLALGADRSRLVRQLLTESALLAVMSAALGLFIAWVASSGLMYLVSPNGSVAVSTAMNGRLLGFTILISVLAVGLFGLVPALRASRVDLASSMRGGASSLSGWAGTGRAGGVPIAKVFIAAQVALSVLLLTGATMLTRSLRNIENAPVGFDRDHLVVIDVDLRTGGYIGARQGPLVHALRDRIAAVPGVAAVTYSVNGIFTGTDGRMPIEVPGFTMRKAADSLISFDFAGPDYARAIGAKLTRGRDMEAADENKPGRTALVNSAFADFYWPGQSPIGKTFHRSDSIVVQVVGVLADARDHSLTADMARRVYFPYIHTDTGVRQLSYSQNLRLEVRTVGDPSNLVQPLRRAVLSVDQSLPIDAIDPVPTLMASSISQQRLLAQLAGGFGVLALVLAAIGLYGVMSYAINRRTGEIGLRVALGAQRADVIRMVLLEAVQLVGMGVVVGLPLALVATRLLATQLHGVAPTDPVSLGIALVVLTGSAVVAALVPAVRASRLSPMRALRVG
ncbi:MAG TPA: ABC transporter permease [Gemmatimonadaceae bacterium]|jgi:predicted permease